MRKHPAIALLSDVALAWPEGLEAWSTDSIRSTLLDSHPERWGPTGAYPNGLTVQRIGRYLGRNFRVRTQKNSAGNSVGYRGADVAAVCARLGIAPPRYVTSETPVRSVTPPPDCPHGVPAGDLPDPWVPGNAIRCTQCRTGIAR